MLARKRFGQHFLIDQQILHTMAQAIAPQLDDHVVEIGPGRGALTDYLVTKTQHIDLIEIDRDLVTLLQQHYVAYPQVRIHQADVLKFPWQTLYEPQQTRLRVVGNLPYNISTPLLVKLLSQAATIFDMHFLVQKEVAERLCAPAGDKHYGRLSVLAQLYSQPEILFLVGSDAFKPPPKVMSAFIRLRLNQHQEMQPQEVDHFLQVVKLAFAHRRKTLANNLKSLISAAMLSSLGIEPTRRAQELTVAEFYKISHYIRQV